MSFKLFTWIVFALLILIVRESSGYLPRIFRGRPKGGFLGLPGSTHHTEGSFRRLAPPPEQWYEQRLDHFDGSNTAVWKQRFFTNSTFWRPSGPLFVNIGGEGAANPIWMVEGAWIEYARKNNAYCVMLEHRFYGKSHPLADMSTDNLRYLSSEQAMADLAAFLTDLKEKLHQPFTVMFGGSYPGSLAAWFRMKYPHIADAAIATSAPLLAKVNFLEYMEVVDAALKTFDSSGSCNNAIAEATVGIEGMIKTYEGRLKLKSLFHLCDDIDPNIAKDIANLYNTLSGNFAGVVQYNKDNRDFEGAKGTKVTIDTLCEIMTDVTVGTPTQRYAAVNQLMLHVYNETCQDFKYDKMIEDMRKTDWNSSAAEGGRQWTYQTCTEFAFYQSSDSDHQPFGHTFPVDFSLQQCMDIFGPKFNSSLIKGRVARSNQDYGAKNIQVTRILFPNGSIDPWHALGILEDLGPDARAIYINGTAHCANMYPPSPKDLPGLVAARVEIDATISKWYTEFQRKHSGS